MWLKISIGWFAPRGLKSRKFSADKDITPKFNFDLAIKQFSEKMESSWLQQKKLKILSTSLGASDNTCFNLMLSNSSNISECSFLKQINLAQNE